MGLDNADEVSLADNANVMFLHFRKVAGTSIVHALQKSCLGFPEFHRNGQPWTSPRDDDQSMLIRTFDFTEEETADWMSDNSSKGVDCMVCEWDVPNNMMESSFEMFTCMRDPYSRFKSEFYFHDNFHVNRGPIEGFVHECRAEVMASQWVQEELYWNRDQGTPFKVSINKPNFYCRILCGLGRQPDVEITQVHFETAKTLLQRFVGIIILGIPESYNLLRRWNFQDRLPRSRVKPGRRDESLLDISKEEFAEVNRFDCLLFEFAEELTRARLANELSRSLETIELRDSEHDAIMAHTDIIIPMKRRGIISRSVFEAVHRFYKPRRLIIVTCSEDCEWLEDNVRSQEWDVGNIQFVEEETLFDPLGVTIDDIKAKHNATTTVIGDRNTKLSMREFGWWFQQIIKLGVGSLIPDVSDTYIVWDADLVPIRRWPLCKLGLDQQPEFWTAILQQASRPGNAKEYIRCLRDMCKVEPSRPRGGGTFVSHHMCFNKKTCSALLNTIMKNSDSKETLWPLAIMDLTNKYCRFSEYLMYATFCDTYEPGGFKHHPFDAYGRGGVRMRSGEAFVRDLLVKSTLNERCVSYDELLNFAREFYKGDIELPPYMQLDHVYVDTPPEWQAEQWRYDVAYTSGKIGKELVDAKIKLADRKHDWWQRFKSSNCIFIHIPKNAGTSVENIFGVTTPSSQHFTAAELQNDSFHDFEKLFKFCLVRNPYERMLSSYRYLSTGGNQKESDLEWQLKLLKLGSFDDFVRAYFTNTPQWTSYTFPHHMIPQFLFVSDPNEGLLIDAWIDMSDFSRHGLGPLIVRGLPTGLVQNEVPHLRKSPSTLISYTEEIADLIYLAYKDDFETFGYHRDSWESYI